MTINDPDDSVAAELNRQQMRVLAQLFQTVPSMHHIDELFQWLAYVIVQQFDVQLAQVWSNYISRSGQQSVQLRAMVPQYTSLPQQVIVNEQIALFAQRVIGERHSLLPQLVTNLFSQYQAILLQRHGLNYCAGCFLFVNALLPPPNNVSTQDKSPTPFIAMILLFLKQSPHLNLVPTISTILEQAVALAGSQNLLLPAISTPIPIPTSPSPSPSFTASTQSKNVLPPLAELIPRRKQDSSLLLTNNPFASGTVISDKSARRLHSAIDGRANIATLCSMTGMNIKEVYAAIQTLLTQNRIEMCLSNGQGIDTAFFLQNW